MAYQAFDVTKPDAVTQNGTQVVQAIRDNIRALRDLVVTGASFGWTTTASGGTPEQRTTVVRANGVERLRSAITWGTTGGEEGNVIRVDYSYSLDSGSTYEAIGYVVNTYDVDGNFVSQAWSW